MIEILSADEFLLQFFNKFKLKITAGRKYLYIISPELVIFNPWPPMTSHREYIPVLVKCD